MLFSVGKNCTFVACLSRNLYPVQLHNMNLPQSEKGSFIEGVIISILLIIGWTPCSAQEETFQLLFPHLIHLEGMCLRCEEWTR